MLMRNVAISATAIVASIAVAGSASATTDISLGASAQDYTLYGQGAYSPGLGSFTNQQGSETFSSGTTTDILSGTISSSSDPSLSSGAYSFVTTYTGMPIASGGQEIQSQSSPSNSNYFGYSYFDPSVDMTLYLTGTPSGSVTIPIVTNGSFDVPNFSFSDVTAFCTGVTSCSQNNVGLTPGATFFGPVTIDVTLASVPEPTTWALMLVGIGGVGGILRRRKSARASLA